MTYQIYCRILGYVVTILLHTGNIVMMGKPHAKELLEHAGIKEFVDLKFRSLTVWTFLSQIVYALVGLFSDIVTLYNSNNKDYKLPGSLKGLRETLFSAIVWPTSLMVFVLFWSQFLYDRNTVYPDFLDKILTPTNNHIMHTAILPIVLWDMVFQHRTKPRTHGRYLAILSVHLALYMTVLTYTYIERGTWIYPILNKIYGSYGTLYFQLQIGVNIVVAVFCYSLQWYLVSALWGNPEEAVKKIN